MVVFSHAASLKLAPWQGVAEGLALTSLPYSAIEVGPFASGKPAQLSKLAWVEVGDLNSKQRQGTESGVY